MFVVGGPIGTGLLLALGGVTFADAWISGIYKRPRERVFVNMSPMAWGIAMALLFIPTYPIYLLNRNKLRTTGGTNDWTRGVGHRVLGAQPCCAFRDAITMMQPNLSFNADTRRARLRLRYRSPVTFVR